MPIDPTRVRALDLDSLGEFVADDAVIDALRMTWPACPPPGAEPVELLRFARVCELLALTGQESVLLAGAGRAWHAAVLARLASWVVVVEADALLRLRVKSLLRDTRTQNVTVVGGTPLDGFEESGPYDAIVVDDGRSPFAGPKRLTEQLIPGGCLVSPQTARGQFVLLCRRQGETRELDHRLMPLVDAT
jgi:protein-L-isoaspartate O-methyltransferase